MKFLFYISKQYSIPIISPLVRYLKTSDHEFGFFVSEKVKKILPPEWQKYRVFSQIDEGKKFQPDFVLAPGNFVDFRLPGIKVQLFHGLGVEKPSHYRIRHFFDVYCTSGPFVTQRFLKLKKKYKYFEVLETGWTKVDHILSYPSVAGFKRHAAIPAHKKLILFAPTHSRKMQSAEELMKTIPLIIRKNEFWLIKFHELMERTIITDFKQNISGNALFINDFDITPYLHLADVLISDTSSVLYEFMLLNKPVISYRTQSRLDKGLNITEPSILRDAIDWTLKNPQAHSQQRKAHVQEINPYLDGKISQRLIESLIENKERFAKIKKPLNLFRKIQILYHQKFRKGYLR